MFDPARLFHCSFTHKLSVVPHRRAVPCRGETVFDTRIRFEASCALQSMNGYLAKQLECRRSIPKKKNIKNLSWFSLVVVARLLCWSVVLFMALFTLKRRVGFAPVLLVHVKIRLSFAKLSWITSLRKPGKIAGMASSGETSCMKRLISFLLSNAWQVFPWTVIGVYVELPFPNVVLVKQDSMLVVKASERSSEDFSNSWRKARGRGRGGGEGEKCYNSRSGW